MPDRSSRRASTLATCALSALVAACGNTGSAGFSTLDAAGPADAPAGDDAPVEVPVADSGPGFVLTDGGAPRDGGQREGGSIACSFGSAASIATSQNLNLFGQIVYYEDGGAFPAGRYRATYVDGCMKYDYLMGWAVQPSPPDAGGGFWLVRSSTTDRIIKPPGTVGMVVGSGGYSTFADCVAANLAHDTPVDFDFDGGPMGVWLDDNPYLDNVAGDNGRNPAWTLTLMQACPPDLGQPTILE